MKRKSFKITSNFGIKIASVILLLLMLFLTAQIGKGGLPADFVEQESWHLINSEVVPEGIRVEICGENLVLHSGVKVKADSVENKELSAYMVRDGISDDITKRWSSANDWENNEHWLEISFPETVTVGFVRIYWERKNVCSYTLEYSKDHKNWITAAEFTECPEEEVQDIYLAEPIPAKYVRLHTMDVVKNEEDLSLYYQNVSVLEMEVYEGIKDSFIINRPEIPAQNRRALIDIEDYAAAAYENEEIAENNVYDESICAVYYPEVPAGYRLRFVGADYDNLVGGDGRIADTIADTVVELGFALESSGVGYELPGMKVEIPAAWENITGVMSDAENDNIHSETDSEKSELPEGYSVMEWKAQGGMYGLTEAARIVVPKEYEEELYATASLFAAELSQLLGYNVEAVVEENINFHNIQDRTEAADMQNNIKTSDIYLSFLQDFEKNDEDSWLDGMGEEGYQICLQSDFVKGTWIVANTAQGIRWGCVSLLDLLEKTQGELPQGIIRDYPRYSVRGFGIDVGRRAVPMEMLYDIVREMSKYKMNTLIVHLNDNNIIAQSDYDGTIEGARSLYSGFRLESGIKSAEGIGITSEDFYYTKEEFSQFIADAAVYGVEIVPEIDTPAHSLFITKVFPNLGLSRNPESVDQLDLSKPETAELVKNIWSEYLLGEDAVFSGCSAVHIGMDEYYGDEKEYINYLTEISNYVRELAPDKEIRIWGSLSQIKTEHIKELNNLQMHIWSTDWTKPDEMYEAGFPIINSLSSSLYIIPGGGYDWLELNFLEEKWQPNVFETKERTWILPAYSPQMLGASYMLWNDLYQLNGERITDEEIFERFAKPLPIIADKLW
ncbi:MAG: family 20 glycosylhydrolase [Butyrivibrio sp.]|nr:family 20 glycosylhydrolase [Butyrivibrio sp.]